MIPYLINKRSSSNLVNAFLASIIHLLYQLPLFVLVNMQKKILSPILLAVAASCQSLSDVLAAQKASLSTLSSISNLPTFGEWELTSRRSLGGAGSNCQSPWKRV